MEDSEKEDELLFSAIFLRNISNYEAEANYAFNNHQTLRSFRSEFGMMAGITTVCSILNGTSIYLISRKKRLRIIDYLIVNLSFSTFFLCCCFMGMACLIHLSAFHILDGTWVCGVINYLKYYPGTVTVFSSFGISLERIQSLQPRKISKSRRGESALRLSPLQIILAIWALAGILCFPSAFMSTSSPRNAKSVITDTDTKEMKQSRDYFPEDYDVETPKIPSCQRVSIFNSKYMDILYELVKLFCMHFLSSFIILYELYIIRSKIKYLCTYSVPGPSLSRKVCRVRFAFLYSILLAIILTSTGILYLMYRLRVWHWHNNSPASSSKFHTILKFVTLGFLLLNPILVFLSNQEYKLLRNLCPCFSKGNEPITATEGENVSRFATQHLTTVEIENCESLETKECLENQEGTIEYSNNSTNCNALKVEEGREELSKLHYV